LVVGYVLTNAVYAFTFGQYLGHVTGLGTWFPQAAAVAIASLILIFRLIHTDPLALAFLLALVLTAVFGRRVLFSHL